MRPSQRPFPRGALTRGAAPYLLAAVLAAAAVWLRAALAPVLGPGTPYALTFVAIVLSALLGGLWAGMTATFAGAGVAALMYGLAALNVITTTLYLLVGVIISLMGGQRKAALAHSRAHAQDLERQMDRRLQDLASARSRAEVLAALGDALQGATTLEQMAARALDPLGTALGASSAMVVRLQGGLIEVPVVWGEVSSGMAALRERPLPLAEAPLLARCARTGEAGYYPDYNAARGGFSGLPALAFAAEPIHLPGRQLAGFLCLWRPTAPQPWPESDRDLLRRAAATLGLTLERAATVQALQERTQALDAFVAFSEQVGSDMGVPALVNLAQGVLSAALGEVSVAYYELEEDRWTARAWSQDISPDFLKVMQAGFPRDTPRFAQAALRREAYFLPSWTPR